MKPARLAGSSVARPPLAKSVNDPGFAPPKDALPITRLKPPWFAICISLGALTTGGASMNCMEPPTPAMTGRFGMPVPSSAISCVPALETSCSVAARAPSAVGVNVTCSEMNGAGFRCGTPFIAVATEPGSSWKSPAFAPTMESDENVSADFLLVL